MSTATSSPAGAATPGALIGHSAIQLLEVERSASNRRFLVTLSDHSRVEAVLYRGDTLCVSTQVGCAVGCPFCASGARGLTRPLTFAELCAQVTEVESLGASLRRVTASGVGEPLHASEAVSDFLRWCRERGTPASVTTSGGPLPRLRELLLAAPHNGVTISVHAGTEPTRARLVPHAPALGPLFALLGDVVPAMSRKRRKKVALAYLLLAGENDTPDELRAFADRVRPLGVAVHLYQHNAVDSSTLHGATREAYERAYALLRDAGLVVRMSSQARLEANGGCGTLVAQRGRPGRRSLPQVHPRGSEIAHAARAQPDRAPEDPRAEDARATGTDPCTS